jgi:hypothetical protein
VSSSSTTFACWATVDGLSSAHGPVLPPSGSSPRFRGLRRGCLRRGLRYHRPDRGLRPCCKSFCLRPCSGAFVAASRPSPRAVDRAEASVFFPCTLLIKLVNRQFLLLLRTLFSVTHNHIPTVPSLRAWSDAGRPCPQNLVLRF